ncbi:MAG: isocitrate lyase/PEP mutase family protein [Deltaproteobacteria bacterium]|nr:isocitrate lyase/PEP mutase family protein [Deltaproteobacteria bacterium]
MSTQTQKLRQLLSRDHCHIMPCCYDGLSAKMVEQAGFPFTFMSGFSVSAARLGLPDTGLISYGEMIDQGRNICGAVSIPVLGDGDTGYGNALNVRRTVDGYIRAGFAAVMIEDQLSPKRCGHTRGKLVVSRAEACERIKAAVDAREEGQQDILIIGRTDARTNHGLDEAMERVRAFSELGADILFVEAPESSGEMETICREVDGVHMANIIHGGKTPALSPSELHSIGFKIAAYPLVLISAVMQAMTTALEDLQRGKSPQGLMPFEDVRRIVGFDDYYDTEKRYQRSRR